MASPFDDALKAARGAVRHVFSQPMTITAIRPGEYSAATPDPARPVYTAPGVLHEHTSRRDGETGITERSDGGRPGGRFGFDLAAAPTRISFDLVDLRHGIPNAGTLIVLADGRRRFEVLHAAPPNGGRIFLYVTEIAMP